MAAIKIIDMTDSQKDLVFAGHTNIALNTIYMREDGFAWVTQGEALAGQPALLGLYTDKGEFVKSLEIPIYDADMSSPNIKTMLLDPSGVLWLADFSYGMIYRYEKGNAQKGEDMTGDVEVFFKPDESAYYQLCGLALDENMLWALNTNNQGHLLAVDITSKVLPLTKPQNIIPLSDKSYTSVNNLVIDNKLLWYIDSRNKMLCALPVTAKDITSLKTFPVGGDIRTFIANTTTRIGYIVGVDGSNGQVWKKNLADDGEVQKLAEISKADELIFIAQDKAGYLWVSDVKESGKIYAVTPEGAVPVAYQMKAIPGKAPWPGQLAWQASADALWVTDRQFNSRVMLLPITGVGPVDPGGNKAYTISADPATGKAAPGKVFSPIAISTQTADGKTPLSGIFLKLASSSPDGTDSSLDVDGGETPLNVSGLKVGDSASEGGKIVLTATGRGMVSPQSVFEGLVHQQAMKFKFTPNNVVRALQNRTFNALNVKFDTDTQGLVTLTLTGPVVAGGARPVTDLAYFPDNSAKKFKLAVPANGTLPVIHAGNAMGVLTVTGSVDGQKDELHWEVIPVPSKFDVPGKSSVNSNAPGWEKSYTVPGISLQGRAVLDDDTSALVAISDYPIQVKVSDEKGIYQFVGGGYTKVYTTNKNGRFFFPLKDLKTPVSFQPFSLSFSYAASLDDKPFFAGTTTMSIVSHMLAK